MLNHSKRLSVFLVPKELKALSIIKIAINEIKTAFEICVEFTYDKFENTVINITEKYNIAVIKPASAISIIHGFSKPTSFVNRRSLSSKDIPIPVPCRKLFIDIKPILLKEYVRVNIDLSAVKNRFIRVVPICV